jgi:hypothetical protein
VSAGHQNTPGSALGYPMRGELTFRCFDAYSLIRYCFGTTARSEVAREQITQELLQVIWRPGNDAGMRLQRPGKITAYRHQVCLTAMGLQHLDVSELLRTTRWDSKADKKILASFPESQLATKSVDNRFEHRTT